MLCEGSGRYTAGWTDLTVEDSFERVIALSLLPKHLSHFFQIGNIEHDSIYQYHDVCLLSGFRLKACCLAYEASLAILLLVCPVTMN